MSKITICIFTYNRANYLREALESIRRNVKQLSGEADTVDVVVSDNCSTDSTKNVVNEYKSSMAITYNCNKVNIGADGNIRMAAELTRGDYIWLFSDDDVIMDGALDYLMAFLNSNTEISYIYYPRVLTDRNLKVIQGGQQPSGVDRDLIFEDGRDLFCSVGGQMPGILFYVSSTIIERSAWEEGASIFPIDLEGFGHAKPILHAILNRKCAVLGKPGLLCRLFNHRDMSSNIWFDNYMSVMVFAKSLGYSKRLCNNLILLLAKSYGATFVLDKACGRRKDSILSAMTKIGCGDLISSFSFWAILSCFPRSLLRLLLPLYMIRRALKSGFAK